MSNPSIVKHDTEGKSACGEVGAAGSQSNDQKKMFTLCDVLRSARRESCRFHRVGSTFYRRNLDALLAKQKFHDIVKKIYDGELSLTNPADKAYIGSDKVKMMVKKVYKSNPRKFFQILEKKARWHLYKYCFRKQWRLDEFVSTQEAIESIQMLLEEYSQFCNSLSSLLYLLKPLEEYGCDLRREVVLMNKKMFCEEILTSTCCSDAIAQLCQACLSSDHNHVTTAVSLIPRFLALCQELDEVSQIWEASKDRRNHLLDVHCKLMETRTQTTAVQDSFVQQQTGSGWSKEVWMLSTPAKTKEERKKSSEKQSSSTGNESNIKSNGDSNAHQEKQAVSFTGERSGRGNDPIYNYGKVNKVYEDESDANQEKPAVDFDGEKSGGGNDPIYKLKKGWVGEADENLEKPAVDFDGPGEKSDYGDDPIYNCGKLKKVCVDEADENREKPAVDFDGPGEKSNLDDDPIYNCGKLKKVCVGEADENQEKPAVNFTGEKSSRGDDPVHKYRKLKEVGPHIRLHGSWTSGWDLLQAYMCILLFTFIPTVTCTPPLLSSSLNESLVACPGQQVQFVCRVDSPLLYWLSPEYIGEPPTFRLELSGEIDRIGTQKRGVNAVATLLGVNGRNVTRSELVLTASSDFPNASVTCVDVLANQSITISLGVPSLIPAVTPFSLSNNLNGSTMACPGQQVRFECLANSPELIWSSPEYIGPTGVRIEFSGTLDIIGTTKRAGNAEATLLGLDGINVTSSELVILVSQDYPTASVTCDDGFQSVTSQFKVPGAPGIPQSIQASISPQSGDCVALLQWDLPIDLTTSSFISHYIVEFVAGMLTIPSQATVAALTIQNCDLNAAIGIRAVDICGRQGARADVILIDVLQDTGSVTEWPSQTTAPSQTDASTYILYFNLIMSILVMAVLIIAVIFVTSGIVIWYYQKKLGKVESAIQLDEYTTSVEKRLLYKEK